jgi:hypothetical protein
MKEEFEDTKGVIRIRKSKKDRQHNDQRKRQWDKQRSIKYIPSRPLINDYIYIHCLY